VIAAPSIRYISDRPTGTKPSRVQNTLDEDLLLQLVTGVCGAAAYESDDEPRPKPEVIRTAAEMIGKGVRAEYRRNMEIEPYWGEIHITWNNKSNRRLKTIFAKDGQSVSVYWEEEHNGNGPQYNIVRNVTAQVLGMWVNWLHA